MNDVLLTHFRLSAASAAFGRERLRGPVLHDDAGMTNNDADKVDKANNVEDYPVLFGLLLYQPRESIQVFPNDEFDN